LLLSHPHINDFGFEKLKRELQRMRRVWFALYLIFGYRRKMVLEFKAALEHQLGDVDEIMKVDCRGVARKALLESADRARDALFLVISIYARLEKLKFLKSAELKKSAEQCLNGFYELERHLRREAYTDADTIPEDDELKQFNASLSQKLPHYLDEI
jgi:hypothetical protein